MRLTRRSHGALAAPAAFGLAAYGDLPYTGSSGVMWWVIGGILVLALGAGLYALSRRRSTAPTDDSGGPPA